MVFEDGISRFCPEHSKILGSPSRAPVCGGSTHHDIQSLLRTHQGLREASPRRAEVGNGSDLPGGATSHPRSQMAWPWAAAMAPSNSASASVSSTARIATCPSGRMRIAPVSLISHRACQSRSQTRSDPTT